MASVLITGAARGIGRSIAEHLASRDWDVVAGVRTEADAAAVTAANPRRITAVTLDVTNDAHIADLARSLPARLDGRCRRHGAGNRGRSAAAIPTEC